MKSKRLTAVFIAFFLVQVASPASAAIVKNGGKCVKEGQIAKVGSKSFTCTNFYGSLMWASKGWAPPAPRSNAYDNAYYLLLSYSDYRLSNLNYNLVFYGSFASRSRAMGWCEDYFVTPSQFGRYYSYTNREINQAVIGCTDAVMRRDG